MIKDQWYDNISIRCPRYKYALFSSFFSGATILKRRLLHPVIYSNDEFVNARFATYFLGLFHCRPRGALFRFSLSEEMVLY